MGFRHVWPVFLVSASLLFGTWGTSFAQGEPGENTTPSTADSPLSDDAEQTATPQDDPSLEGLDEDERAAILKAREEDKVLTSDQGDTFTPVDREKHPLEPMPRWMLEDETKRDWTFSLAPGYSLLYLSQDKETRHGGGLRGLVAYNFTDHWSLDTRLTLSLNDGDRGDDAGLYSLTTLLAAARYTFFPYETVVRPFVYMGLGWGYSSYDLEALRIVRSHHLVLEPGGGFSARVYKHWHLGFEASLTPFFLGNAQIADSFTFFPRFVIEYQL